MSTVHLDLKSIVDDSEWERLHRISIDLATFYIKGGYYSRDLMPHQPTLVWCFFSLQWRPKRGWFLLICCNMERPIADMKRRTKRVEIKRKRSGDWAGWYTAVHFNLEMFLFHMVTWLMVFALFGEPNGRPNESHVAFHWIVSLGLKKNVSHIYTLASVLSRTGRPKFIHLMSAVVGPRPRISFHLLRRTYPLEVYDLA